MMKLSHHKTFTSATKKRDKLQTANSHDTFVLRVNEDAPFMPHEVHRTFTCLCRACNMMANLKAS